MTDTEIITASTVLPAHRVISSQVLAGWNKVDLGHDQTVYPRIAFAREAVRFIDPEAIDRELTLARFLATLEDVEDACPEKPTMEDECLRTDRGECHACGASGPRWRYEIQEEHYRWLMCDCETLQSESLSFNGQICKPCAHGYSTQDTDVACEDLLDPDGLSFCRWADWLDGGRLPWLCARCWKDAVDDEGAHVSRLTAAADA